MKKDTDEALDIQETLKQAAEDDLQTKKEEDIQYTLQQLKDSVTEDDDAPASSLSLMKILGGDVLSRRGVIRQVWLCLLIALFLTFYVAFRYQCQQDMIDIAQLEKDLTDAKYKALSSSSQLTERCRESKVLKALQQNMDSLERVKGIHPSVQPPYKVYIPEEK